MKYQTLYQTITIAALTTLTACGTNQQYNTHQPPTNNSKQEAISNLQKQGVTIDNTLRCSTMHEYDLTQAKAESASLGQYFSKRNETFIEFSMDTSRSPQYIATTESQDGQKQYSYTEIEVKQGINQFASYICFIALPPKNVEPLTKEQRRSQEEPWNQDPTEDLQKFLTTPCEGVPNTNPETCKPIPTNTNLTTETTQYIRDNIPNCDTLYAKELEKCKHSPQNNSIQCQRQALSNYAKCNTW